MIDLNYWCDDCLVGTVHRDLDPRCPERLVKVTDAKGQYAYCERVPDGRKTRILRHRLARNFEWVRP